MNYDSNPCFGCKLCRKALWIFVSFRSTFPIYSPSGDPLKAFKFSKNSEEKPGALSCSNSLKSPNVKTQLFTINCTVSEDVWALVATAMI